MIPTTKNESQNKETINSITNKTKKKLKENGWRIIGGEKRWVRICPKCNCNKEIYYKSIYNFYIGVEKNTICSSCHAGNASRGNRWTKKRKKEWIKKCNTLFTRENNPTNDLRIRKKISDFAKIRIVSDETKKKLSIKNSGKNNPRYGKCPPKSVGSGWHCWYDKKYFRSCRELIYYIQQKNKGIKCECVEHKIIIKYKNEFGMERTYRPDFLVDDKMLVEIKPKYLWNSKLVVLKKEAAEKFCRNMGYKYLLVDVDPDFKLLKEKYLNQEIKFVDKYKERFEKYAGITR